MKWKSVKKDGFPNCDQDMNLLLYSQIYDITCIGYWHNKQFHIDDVALFFVAESISHYFHYELPTI